MLCIDHYFVQYGFIQVCKSYILFWKSTFSSLGVLQFLNSTSLLKTCNICLINVLCDQVLGDFVFTLYKLLFCKNKNKIVSEKTWFIYEEKSGASKIKSSAENVTSMIYEFFILELLILALDLQSYCGDKKWNTDFFKSLVSKSARTWRLKRPQHNDKLL